MKGKMTAIENLSSEQFGFEELTADQLKDVNGGLIMVFMAGYAVGTWLNDNYIDPWLWG